MGALTIRQLDERTYARLRTRAVKHGRTVEAEVRAILDAAVDVPEENFLQALHKTMSEVGGADLPHEPRTDLPRSSWGLVTAECATRTRRSSDS